MADERVSVFITPGPGVRPAVGTHVGLLARAVTLFEALRSGLSAQFSANRSHCDHFIRAYLEQHSPLRVGYLSGRIRRCARRARGGAVDSDQHPGRGDIFNDW